EQDADMVCFIHRPEYYTRSGEDGNGNDIRGKAELIIAKHRSGAVGTVDLRFVSKFARFENWEEGYQVIQNTISEAGTIRNSEAGATRKVESRMNSDINDADSISGFTFASGPSSPMPDIMPGPGESPVPF
ncbi:MAG: hypothetical protein K2K97_10745, partial [Muribaculaceae bacterium]|nr:hypothetical protein [Muribaculaceae bacterium]